jgi:SRSO17 transposase
MKRQERATPAARFDQFTDRLCSVIGHADRHKPLRAYVTGLLLPGDRKSVEPMAAKIDPRHVSALHQSMHHFVANAPWDEREVLAVARDHALAQLERHAPVGAWVVDDTGIPKKGRHSVGVARQYCGVLGKQENCQVVVTVSLVNRTMSVPAAYRLYLPESWAEDPERRREATIPRQVSFVPKWRIALEEIDRLLEEDLPPAPVVADAGYGDTTAFRDAITARGFSYAVGIKPETTVWPPGKGPLPPKPYGGRGQPPKVLRRDADHQPLSVRTLAESLPSRAFKTVQWREGTKGTMRSRFAAVRVRPAHRDERRHEPREIEWLVIEWPKGKKEPTKYWLSTVPEDVDLPELVALAKIRWRIERDYQELKDQIGLDHYEGRGWRGFHHHGILCIAAYCLLAAERGRLSPPQPLAFLQPAPLPKGFAPRGSPRKTRKA